jgi:hypothetical protein
MPRRQTTPRIRAQVRPPAEMTESQVESLMTIGRHEAEIVDAIVTATRAGDQERAWALAQQLCAIEDQITQV